MDIRRPIRPTPRDVLPQALHQLVSQPKSSYCYYTAAHKKPSGLGD